MGGADPDPWADSTTERLAGVGGGPPCAPVGGTSAPSRTGVGGSGLLGRGTAVLGLKAGLLMLGLGARGLGMLYSTESALDAPIPITVLERVGLLPSFVRWISGGVCGRTLLARLTARGDLGVVGDSHSVPWAEKDEDRTFSGSAGGACAELLVSVLSFSSSLLDELSDRSSMSSSAPTSGA